MAGAMRASPASPVRPKLPQSDVSSCVGLAGLLGLAVWILFCRNYASIADLLDCPSQYHRPRQ